MSFTVLAQGNQKVRKYSYSVSVSKEKMTYRDCIVALKTFVSVAILELSSFKSAWPLLVSTDLV